MFLGPILGLDLQAQELFDTVLPKPQLLAVMIHNKLPRSLKRPRHCCYMEGLPCPGMTNWPPSHSTTTLKLCHCSPLNVNHQHHTLQYWSFNWYGFSVCVCLRLFWSQHLTWFIYSGQDQHGFWNCVTGRVWGMLENLSAIWSHSNICILCERSLVIARRCIVSWSTISSVR